MKALNHFVVRVDKVFNDTMEVGEKSIYLDSSGTVRASHLPRCYCFSTHKA